MNYAVFSFNSFSLLHFLMRKNNIKLAHEITNISEFIESMNFERKILKNANTLKNVVR